MYSNTAKLLNSSPFYVDSRDLRRVILIASVSSLFGLLYSVIMGEGWWLGLVNGVLNGLVIGILDTLWVRKRRGRWLRQLPILFYISLLTLLWVLIITVNMVLTRHWLGLDHGFDLQWTRSDGFMRHFLFCLFMAFTFNFILRIIAFMGSRSLVSILLGRYQEPAQKQIAFLFLDVVGSSRMTERIGDTQTQKLIGELFFEVAVIVERFGGDVHRYIGDEMVITWELADNAPMPDILGCLSQIYEIVESGREENQARHQTWADLRAGLNAGPVLVSEIGDLKRELVYFGDSINTAAALQNQCKIEGVRMLISSVLYKQLNPSPRLKAQTLGPLSIKGKQRQIDTVSLTFG